MSDKRSKRVFLGSLLAAREEARGSPSPIKKFHSGAGLPARGLVAPQDPRIPDEGGGLRAPRGCGGGGVGDAEAPWWAPGLARTGCTEAMKLRVGAGDPKSFILPCTLQKY